MLLLCCACISYNSCAASRVSQSTTGFIHMKLEEEPPIFSKQKVNFSPTDRITHLAVSNELLVLAMANSILLLIDLRQPNNPQGNDDSLRLL
jgi:hypothetical protein